MLPFGKRIIDNCMKSCGKDCYKTLCRWTQDDESTVSSSSRTEVVSWHSWWVSTSSSNLPPREQSTTPRNWFRWSSIFFPWRLESNCGADIKTVGVSNLNLSISLAFASQQGSFLITRVRLGRSVLRMIDRYCNQVRYVVSLHMQMWYRCIWGEIITSYIEILAIFLQ